MIYFDNAATTKVADSVLASYAEVSRNFFGNPSSLHDLGEKTSHLLKQSREQIAGLLKVDESEIFFTSGGTEGDNWAIKGTAFEKISYGKHIITTSVEHPAVKESMEQLKGLGWEITYLPVNNEGVISLDELKKEIRKDTVLVSVIVVNNEMGSIQPLDKIGEILEDHPTIHYHVDAVQTVGKINLNLNESRIDLAVFSGHKFNAPKGTGFMYIKKGRKLTSLLSGGGQELGQRSGTENVPGNLALAKALRLVLDNQNEKRIQMNTLRENLVTFLGSLTNVTIFSPADTAPHIICFGIKNIKGEVVVHGLEKDFIYVSTTSACSSIT